MQQSPLTTLPQAVLFDWDNTLIENWQALTGAMNAALRHFCLPTWDTARMKENSKLSLRNSFPEIFGRNWESARDIFYTHFRESHLEGLSPMAGAEELLTLLSHHGVKLAVCSNKNGDLLRREARHLNWTPYFFSITGAQDAEKDKPDAAPVRFILTAGGLQAGQNIWFVGDTSTDMICGTRSGCLPVGVGDMAKDDPAYPPALWVEDLPALLTQLRQLLV